MVSAINPALPITGLPTTPSVRSNFQIAHDEISALQAFQAAGPFLPIAGGRVTGQLRVDGPLLVNTASAVGTELLNVNGAFVLGGTLGLGGTINVVGGTPAIINSGVTAYPPTPTGALLWLTSPAQSTLAQDGFGSACTVRMRVAGGTPAAPVALANGAAIASYQMSGYDTAGYTGTRAQWVTWASQPWTPTNHATYMSWYITKTATTVFVEAMRLSFNANLILGSPVAADDGINRLQVGGPSLATFLGERPTVNIALTGSAQAGAYPYATGANFVGTVPVGSGGALPQIGSIVTAGAIVDVFNGTTVAARTYATGTQTVDGAAAATGVPLSGNARCRYIANTGSTWVSTLLGGPSA
jgi:hypothetical protein